jgi:carboxyl-terminal processing protease
MTNREGFIDFLVNPRRATADGRLVKPYAGPLAILVDPLSASTSEIFAAGLQELGRAVVIGQTTAGAALPSMATKLPNGDVLQFAVADFVTPEGNRIEGHGVVPDLPVTLTAELLAREPDPVLAAALRWIAEQHRRSADQPSS